jgi:hypothetical protein
MNIYKKQDIVSFIRKQGKLPTDQFGQILPINDLLLWFELDKCLTRPEQEIIKKELTAIAEAQETLDKLKRMERSGTNLSS